MEFANIRSVHWTSRAVTKSTVLSPVASLGVIITTRIATCDDKVVSLQLTVFGIYM